MAHISVPLGKYTAMFQEEALAIYQIFTDSQAEIKALVSTQIKSRLTWECLQNLLTLACRNEVTLVWMPEHRVWKIACEIADELARAESDKSVIGPDSSLEVSMAC